MLKYKHITQSQHLSLFYGQLDVQNMVFGIFGCALKLKKKELNIFQYMQYVACLHCLAHQCLTLQLYI